MNLNLFTFFVLLLFVGCKTADTNTVKTNLVFMRTCYESDILVNPQNGCDGQPYPDLETSLYVLPYPPGKTYATGLTNCSSSFHAKGKGDEYAFDFNMPNNTPFHAIRAGTVIAITENHRNYRDGSSGNFVYIDHGDDTFGLYYHSPKNGIEVEIGDVVEQGQRLGLTGTSGYAGYPHLHLIVVKGSTSFPFNGIPISFKNVNPRHTVLKSNYSGYQACEY